MRGNEEKCSEMVEQNLESESDCSDQVSHIVIACELDESNGVSGKKITIFGYKLSQIKWFNVVWLILIHLLAIYAYIHALLNPVKIWTLAFVGVIGLLSGFGMSVGAHRLWSHRSFKARFPLRLLLAIFQTMTVNGSVFSYARDHRTHHKWSETDADPKNPSRGFFFAHIGWWLLKKRPEVIENGRKLQFNDLLDDPIVKYQHKFYIPLVIIFAYIFPTLIPFYFWNENILTAFLISCGLRIVVVLHHLFTVNSVSHFWGYRPYDNHMRPTENRFVVYLSMGEGSHNYHHTFPMDYSSSEKKFWEFFNPATLFIDLNSWIGLAYDLKKPSKEMVNSVVQRKGTPEYFEKDESRSFCYRLVYGLTDWIFGLLFAMWPIWPILIIKLLTGQQIIVN